jgi:ADP-ribosyl-[dinitrogen reductase] hydrolase
VCGSHLFTERPAQPHVILRVATLDEDPGIQATLLHIWYLHDVVGLQDCEDVLFYQEWHPGR